MIKLQFNNRYLQNMRKGIKRKRRKEGMENDQQNKHKKQQQKEQIHKRRPRKRVAYKYLHKNSDPW